MYIWFFICVIISVTVHPISLVQSFLYYVQYRLYIVRHWMIQVCHSDKLLYVLRYMFLYVLFITIP